MEKHIRIISTIMIVFGVIYLIAAVCIGILGITAVSNEAQSGGAALLPAGLTGAVLLLPLILLGILHIFTGRGFREGKSWARIVLWILSILNLGNVPLGTLVGVYAIWVLVKTG